MASKIHNLFHLLALLLFLNNINTFTKPSKADDNLIQNTCKTTKDMNLCISVLESDPNSSNSDLKGLATIMVNVAIHNTTETYSYLSSQLISSTSDITMKKVVEFCATKYSNAIDSLKSSIDDLSMENYDYASMHVMAAQDYPNVCRNAFRRYRGLAYPAQLKAREDGLKRICSVVLGVFDQLFTSFGNRS